MGAKEETMPKNWHAVHQVRLKYHMDAQTLHNMVHILGVFENHRYDVLIKAVFFKRPDCQNYVEASKQE